MKIMIVDDHGGIREMLRGLLAIPGVELAECADGREALATYQRFQADWVFMDSVMKELDGLSATRQIMRDFPEARVLVVSEDDFPQLRRAAHQAGAAGFVTKEHLLRALSRRQGTIASQLELLCAPRASVEAGPVL